ncbi:hypothetical protein RHS01_05288 [Rhizoctonia solani]|uniref:Arrestin-like N-terminal domain-containing protein n=1 Tax=Rhizoctonia solani TaxID=456999 RepID=A0A8H7M4T1_9AGAM|nr:hypothetical protein RHS01_05288 [Rhizoctonia solani]
MSLLRQALKSRASRSNLRDGQGSPSSSSSSPPPPLPAAGVGAKKSYAKSIKSVASVKTLAASLASFYTKTVGPSGTVGTPKRRRSPRSELGKPAFASRSPELKLVDGVESCCDDMVSGVSTVRTEDERVSLLVHHFGESGERGVIFYGGTFVSGEVRLVASKPDPIESIEVWIHLKSSCTFSEHEPSVLELRATLYRKSGELLPGTYVFPFTFDPFPESVVVRQEEKKNVTGRPLARVPLPPSYNVRAPHWMGRIEYEMGLVIKRRGMKPNDYIELPLVYRPRHRLKPDWPFESETIGGWSLTPFGGRGRWNGSENAEVEGLLGIPCPIAIVAGSKLRITLLLWGTASARLLIQPDAVRMRLIRAHVMGLDALSPSRAHTSRIVFEEERWEGVVWADGERERMLERKDSESGSEHDSGVGLEDQHPRVVEYTSEQDVDEEEDQFPAMPPSFRYKNMAVEYLVQVIISHRDYNHISPSGPGIVGEAPVWVVGTLPDRDSDASGNREHCEQVERMNTWKGGLKYVGRIDLHRGGSGSNFKEGRMTKGVDEDECGTYDDGRGPGLTARVDQKDRTPDSSLATVVAPPGMTTTDDSSDNNSLSSPILSSTLSAESVTSSEESIMDNKSGNSEMDKDATCTPVAPGAIPLTCHTVLPRKPHSNQYETMEELLAAAGYTVTRVFTPETERTQKMQDQAKDEHKGAGGAGIGTMFAGWIAHILPAASTSSTPVSPTSPSSTFRVQKDAGSNPFLSVRVQLLLDQVRSHPIAAPPLFYCAFCKMLNIAVLGLVTYPFDEPCVEESSRSPPFILRPKTLSGRLPPHVRSLSYATSRLLRRCHAPYQVGDADYHHHGVTRLFPNLPKSTQPSKTGWSGGFVLKQTEVQLKSRSKGWFGTVTADSTARVRSGSQPPRASHTLRPPTIHRTRSAPRPSKIHVPAPAPPVRPSPVVQPNVVVCRSVSSLGSSSSIHTRSSGKSKSKSKLSLESDDDEPVSPCPVLTPESAHPDGLPNTPARPVLVKQRSTRFLRRSNQPRPVEEDEPEPDSRRSSMRSGHLPRHLDPKFPDVPVVCVASPGTVNAGGPGRAVWLRDPGWDSTVTVRK